MLGEKIKQFREKNNYSQRELAGMLNVSVRSVGRWERNNAKPSVDEVKALADLFGISETELLRADDDRENKDNESVEVLNKISDGIDNLVTGQDIINHTVVSGQEEFQQGQTQLLNELKNQNEALMTKINDNQKSYDLQKEILKQKKKRNVILLVAAIIIVILVAIFLWILAAFGTNSSEIYADQPVVYKAD